MFCSCDGIDLRFVARTASHQRDQEIWGFSSGSTPPLSLRACSRDTGASQVGDTVRLLVQDVDTERRRLSLALEDLDAARLAGASLKPAVAAEKRPVVSLGYEDSGSSAAKRAKK